jgi:hypothetical protein
LNDGTRKDDRTKRLGKGIQLFFSTRRGNNHE